MAHRPNCSLQSVRVVRVKGSTIVTSPQQRRPSVSPWKIFLQSARSARGCRSETSASTARKSIASMRVTIIPCDVERVKLTGAPLAYGPIGRSRLLSNLCAGLEYDPEKCSEKIMIRNILERDDAVTAP